MDKSIPVDQQRLLDPPRNPPTHPSMAQPPEGTAATIPAPPMATTSVSLLEVPLGLVFRPEPRCLLDRYLVPMALDGRLPEDNVRNSVPEGVDVYAVRPEALPFPRCNRDRLGQVWGYFFATRPAAAGADEDEDVREVAAGGTWRRYGGDKGYAGDDGEVYAFRRSFAFHEAGDGDGDGGGGRKTVWRMKEFRLNEAAPAFRGAVFHPSAEGLVVWMVHNQVILVEEADDHYYSSDDDGEEVEEIAIPVGYAIADADAAPAA